MVINRDNNIESERNDKCKAGHERLMLRQRHLLLIDAQLTGYQQEVV